MVVTLVWSCFLMIRLGNFRFASALFLIGCLAVIMNIYSAAGINGRWLTQITHVLSLILAGVIFGRRALWLTLIFTYLCVLSDICQELHIQGNSFVRFMEVMQSAAAVMVSFRIVAVVFDSAVAHHFNNILGVILGYAQRRDRYSRAADLLVHGRAR